MIVGPEEIASAAVRFASCTASGKLLALRLRHNRGFRNEESL
jgi:hypothetical protein